MDMLRVTGLLFCAIMACSPALQAEVSLRAEKDIYIFENASFRIEVDASGGARIRSWVLKESGKEMVALWKDRNELGGALDDRAFFTAMRYRAGIMRPGPEEAVLRLETSHPSGLGILKILTVKGDEPILRVQYTFRNGMQVPMKPWIRNFVLPGSKPQTESHLYWINGSFAGEGKPDAANYYDAVSPEYAALWDKETGDGFFVVAPGIKSFYFWRGSREYPTFEWVYPELPAGKEMAAEVAIQTVSGQKTPPLWSDMATSRMESLNPLRPGDLEGWTDETSRFSITEEERQRGLWLSVGRDDGKHRLPDPMPLDLPRMGERYLDIAINVLRDFESPILLEIPAAWQDKVAAYWETSAQDRCELLPLPETPYGFKTGAVERLWLRIDAKDAQEGEHEISLRLKIGEYWSSIPLLLRVWPVTVDVDRPFHIRGYGDTSTWVGGWGTTEKELRRFEAILRAYAGLGGDVLDFSAVWYKMTPNIKIEETGESLAEVAKNSPEKIDLNNLPHLDFSYYDPWFDLAKKYGVTRIESSMISPFSSRAEWYLFNTSVGEGRVKGGTPEAERVVAWYYSEIKRYLEQRGFHGFFGKISDEISPEHIPDYIKWARVARQACWRPFTTITGMIARTATQLREMNPYCDQWQLGFGSKDTFLSLTNTKFRIVEKRFELKGPWSVYQNGGAEETWSAHIFGEGSATNIGFGSVESFDLLEDGKPLEISGGSPWGNKKHGFVFTSGALGTHLYLSPFDGKDPANHRYELTVNMRQESPEGEALVTIDPSDEVWFYGGGSRPYLRSYEASYNYPIMAIAQGFKGYALWAFYWWQQTERIIFLDEETYNVTFSPSYCGYRDGWLDARLFAQLIQKHGRDALEGVIGETDEAVLRVGSSSQEVYTFKTLLNADDPLARNRARKMALRQLAQ